MANATTTRSEQQEDLLEQLQKAGAPTATSADSLDTLMSNSALAKGILGVIESDVYARVSFNSAAPKPVAGLYQFQSAGPKSVAVSYPFNSAVPRKLY